MPTKLFVEKANGSRKPVTLTSDGSNVPAKAEIIPHTSGEISISWKGGYIALTSSGSEGHRMLPGIAQYLQSHGFPNAEQSGDFIAVTEADKGAQNWDETYNVLRQVVGEAAKQETDMTPDDPSAPASIPG